MGNAGLSLLSTVITATLFIGIYEVVKNSRYSTWRKNFDNQGWFGKITVPSENPVLMWEYRPYGEFEQIRTNRWGFRDVDYESKENPRDVFRVAFAGDSVTLGLTVGAQETFVRQFEIEANKVRGMLETGGIGFQVIVLPVFPGSSIDEYPIRQMHEEPGEFFAENGIRYLDLLEAFSREEQALGEFSIDIWHPNPKGHRFIARQSVASILAN
jgi:hypothetical protein